MLGALVYFGIILLNTEAEYTIKSEESAAILAIPQAQKVVSLKETNITKQNEFQAASATIPKDVKAYYVYKNITFISYSEKWDENGLQDLCEELLLNKHGNELDYLDEVTVYGQDDEEVLGTQHTELESLDIPLSLTQMIPSDFLYEMPNNISVLSLYKGDSLTTVEQMANTLSHEYGHHFTLYYFNLEGEATDIENDPYFIARFVEDSEIRYLDKDRNDYKEYLDNHMWYLIELAAEDYVYLMGSPTTKREIEYLDTRDILYMKIRNQDDEVDQFYEINNESSFNQAPHENIVLPLPDQIDGLAELFYSQIGLEAPQYVDRGEESEDIELKITRLKKQGKTYYKVYWNKPWTSEDVTYTLVAYNENDELVGAIKTVAGDESARAYIGAVVIETDNYYHWFNSDYWTDQDFLRFRVVVTFSDGTSAISSPLDRSFS